MAVTALKTLLMSREQSLRVKEPGDTCVPNGSSDSLLNFMMRYYSDLTPSGSRQVAPKKISQEAGLRKKNVNFLMPLLFSMGKEEEIFLCNSQLTHGQKAENNNEKNLTESIIYEQCLQLLRVKYH